MRRIVMLALSCAVVGTVSANGDTYQTPQDHPGFASPQFINTPLDKAYPGIEYNIRPAIKGGLYPYAFDLLKAPKGMTIDRRKGAVTWIASKGDGKTHQVVIKVTDAREQTAEQAFDVLVSKKGFYFVSQVGDDEKGNGTIEKPWKTIEKANAPGFTYSPGAIVYVRTGTYTPVGPKSFPENKRGGDPNCVVITSKSPRRWIAYPGERPIIDLGWSAEKQGAAIAPQRLKTEQDGKDPKTNHWTTKRYGHRFKIARLHGFYFDGFIVRNMCYYGFEVYGRLNDATWRRCEFSHLYSDWAENPSFIFAWSMGRKNRDINFHSNFVIQDNYFHDRFYNKYGRRSSGHGGAIVLYTVKDSVIEDNRIEKIQLGWTICDKDSGLGNTYRGNLFSGTFGLASQQFHENIEICHNVIDGKLMIGWQPGWLRNIWIHHNTIRGLIHPLKGALRFPEESKLDETSGNFSKPTTADSIRVVRAAPSSQGLVNVYRNVIVPPADGGAKRTFMVHLMHNNMFADRFRYLNWDENLIDVSARACISWQKEAIPWSIMTEAGFDLKSVFEEVTLDENHNVMPGNPHLGQYGHQIGRKR